MVGAHCPLFGYLHSWLVESIYCYVDVHSGMASCSDCAAFYFKSLGLWKRTERGPQAVSGVAWVGAGLLKLFPQSKLVWGIYIKLVHEGNPIADATQ